MNKMLHSSKEIETLRRGFTKRGFWSELCWRRMRKGRWEPYKRRSRVRCFHLVDSEGGEDF